MTNNLYDESKLEIAYKKLNKIKTTSSYKRLNLPEQIDPVTAYNIEKFFIIDNKNQNNTSNNDNFLIETKLNPKIRYMDLFSWFNYPTFTGLTDQLKKDLPREKKYYYIDNNIKKGPDIEPNEDNYNFNKNITNFNTFFLNQNVFKNMKETQKYKTLLMIDIISTQTISNSIHNICNNLLLSKNITDYDNDVVLTQPADEFTYGNENKKPRYNEYFLTDTNIYVVSRYYGLIYQPNQHSRKPCGGVSLKLTFDLTNKKYLGNMYIEYHKDCNYNIENLKNVMIENEKTVMEENVTTLKTNYFTNNLDVKTCVGCGVGVTGLAGTLLLAGILGGKHKKRITLKSKLKKLKTKKSKTKKSKNKKPT
jgi:hypothetical protein